MSLAVLIFKRNQIGEELSEKKLLNLQIFKYIYLQLRELHIFPSMNKNRFLQGVSWGNA